jgi:PAS domain S-box-containing protein
MARANQDYWRRRFDKLKAENLSLKEKLSTLKRENRELQKVLRNKDRLFQDETGYTAEEVIGRSFLDFVHPDLKKSMRNMHKKRISGKKVPNQYEADLVTKGGEKICCEARVRRIRFNGRRAFLVNLTRLEKRKKREEELIQSKKKEALITMASGLSGKLGHDLKGIPEQIQHMRATADSENGALRERLQHMEAASMELINTNRTLEGLSQSDGDASRYVLFDLRKTIKDAVSRINPKLKELAEGGKQTINLKTYLRSVSPIEGDPDEIGALVSNAILNAVEAMPRGGDLYLTIEENAGYAHVFIQDSGVGIPDPIRDRIWDPFFSTKGKDALGLGLSLSQAIVKRHKGEMELASQKDQGTTLTIRLPLAHREEKSRAKSAKGKVKNAHILLIEDGAIISELLSRVFVSKGHRVVTAGGGREGLRQLRKKRFDLVMADFRAADMDAKVLVQKIRKQKRDLPIALMTEHVAAGKPKPLKGWDVDLVITKPLDMKRVVGQVEEVLRLKGRKR